jgi:uncharacterized damage-inducible protein DinB
MLRTVSCRCLCVVAIALASAFPATAHEAPAAQPAAGGGLQADVAADLERTGGRLVALAEAIPADKYGWRPSAEVRSVSEVLMHVAVANLLIPPALGATPPAGVALPPDMPAAMAWMREREAQVTAKDDVIRELRQSVDYAAAAARALPSPAMEDEIDLFGFPASRRAYLLILLTHNHEHLGQSIAYARSVGVTPPWSETAAAPAEQEKPTDGY